MQFQTKTSTVSQKDQLMATNGAKHTCAYVHEGFPEQNAYKCFHNHNVSTRFLIDFNRAKTKPNQTIFLIKSNQIKQIARATISHQTKWGPKQNPNCSTWFNSWPDLRVVEQENIVVEEGGSGVDLGWKKTLGPLQLLARSASVFLWIYETQETGMHGGRMQTNPGTLTSRWCMV